MENNENYRRSSRDPRKSYFERRFDVHTQLTISTTEYRSLVRTDTDGQQYRNRCLSAAASAVVVVVVVVPRAFFDDCVNPNLRVSSDIKRRRKTEK